MVAHSLRGDVFGPAQRLHGATYVVDLELRRARLDRDGIVVDMGRAAHLLRTLVGALSYRNLDDEGEFTGRNTTTEFLARLLFDRFVAAVARGELGEGGRELDSIKVTLHESHIASASFEGSVAGPS